MKLRHSQSSIPTFRCAMSTAHGLTLLELILALGLSSIVVSLVYFSLGYMNRHMTVARQRTAIQQETNRIVTTIASQIRRAQGVLRWSERSIAFLSANQDTGRYHYDGSVLLYNNRPVVLSQAGLRITGLKIHDVNESIAGNTRHLLLTIAVSTEDIPGNTAEYSLSIKTFRIESEELDDSWDF